jgi:hypothetical protein
MNVEKIAQRIFLSMLVLLSINKKMIWICLMGPNSLKCTKILSQHQPFLSFLPSLFLSCKDIFMDDYNRIYNCNGIKYNHFENFSNF